MFLAKSYYTNTAAQKSDPAFLATLTTQRGNPTKSRRKKHYSSTYGRLMCQRTPPSQRAISPSFTTNAHAGQSNGFLGVLGIHINRTFLLKYGFFNRIEIKSCRACARRRLCFCLVQSVVNRVNQDFLLIQANLVESATLECIKTFLAKLSVNTAR